MSKMSNFGTKKVKVSPAKNKFVSDILRNNKRIEEPMVLELNKKEIQRAMNSAAVTSVSKDGKETPLDTRNWNDVPADDSTIPVVDKELEELKTKLADLNTQAEAIVANEKYATLVSESHRTALEADIANYKTVDKTSKEAMNVLVTSFTENIKNANTDLADSDLRFPDNADKARSALQETIDSANSIKNDNFYNCFMVDESIKSTFEMVLNNATTIITKDDATAEDLNNANKTLQNSIKTVQIEKSKYEIVKNKIAETIALATELTSADDFAQHATKDEQNNLTSKLESATSVKNAEKSTYTELNTANTELESAIDTYIAAIKAELKEYIDTFEACIKGEGEYADYKKYITSTHKTQVEECISEMNTLYNNPSATKANLVQGISKADEVHQLIEKDYTVGITITTTKKNLTTAVEKADAVKDLEYYPYFIQQNAEETKTAFETELQNAKDTLSNFDSIYTVESVSADDGKELKKIDSVMESLNTKRTGMVSSQKHFVETYRPSLQDAINNANSVISASDFANYSTEEKRIAIKTATDNLNTLVANNKSYYSDLEAANVQLQQAIKAYKDDKEKKQQEDL